MTDSELLELAANAAGIRIEYIGMLYYFFADDDKSKEWNPLIDDGDAIRLAVKLGIDITVSGKNAASTSYINGPCFQEYANGNLKLATRRAIVRAAAAIGGAA